MFANTKTNNTPFFWAKLFSDPNFKTKVQSRWKELRESVFGTDKIMAFIDSCAGYLNEAQQRNFVQWPVLGVFIWRESKGYQDRNTYQKEIDYLKSFLTARLGWVDTQLLNTSNVATEPHAHPVDFSLAQNYPNPFNPSTKITYTLKSSSTVRLSVYDLLGREAAVLVNDERKAAGKYEVTFNSTNVSSGIYFYRLQTDNFVKTNKMVVIK
jgi:hypothetical protein